MRVKTCECGKKIVFLDTKKGGTIPVNVETVSDTDIQKLFYGEKVLFEPKVKKHISHFADCPNAQKFRRKNE